MKFIIRIIKDLLSKDTPMPVGRWKIDYCNNKMNNKIDLSNEDHCGSCAQYAINKIEILNKQKLNIIEKQKK